MLVFVGISTIVGVALLLAAYRFTIGPRGAVAAFPSLAQAVSTLSPDASSQCVRCHQDKGPGIVQQYYDSKHAGRGVQCLDCHAPVSGQQALTEQHYQVAIVASPTPNNCIRCHKDEVNQFAESRHSARAWFAVNGSQGFSQDDLKKYHLLDSAGKPLNSGKPNAVANLIGPDASAASCQVCHGIGRKNADGSFGDCTKCHLRHSFSVAQSRQPETCAQCHLGPDHPQSEIYNESAHGAYYLANKDKFNLDAPAGTLTVKDFPAPTCATCHMSAFGSVKGTHDVGQRLKWNLAPAIATVRPEGEQGRQNMTDVCLNCHTQDFINKQMNGAEKVIALTNDTVNKGQAIVDDLKRLGLLPDTPFGSSIDFTMFELWHHEGRRARFGAVMGGADYVNWHGIYEQKKTLIELQADAAELKRNH